uniref:Apolipoprotein M n=1 Tax=Myripristis murdjan TaxID=586833 RepID=A0A667Y8H5_9TELE
MCVRFSVCFLLAGLYLSSSAPTPEDCDPLVTPEPLNHTKLLGRWNIIAGFSDHKLFISLLKTVNSSWMEFTPSPSSNDTWLLAEENMFDGKCNSSRATVTIDGNIAKLVRKSENRPDMLKHFTRTQEFLPCHFSLVNFI